MITQSTSHRSSPSECRAAGLGPIPRARRILGTRLTYIDHPSFDDPTARDAIVAPLNHTVDDQVSRRLQPPEWLAPLPAGRSEAPFLSREQEAHLFRKMNYLKCRANQLARNERRSTRRRGHSFALYEESLTASDPGVDEHEREEAQNQRRSAVRLWLSRLDKRERWILARRYGIGGAPEQTLTQLAQRLGISKERVRQIAARAHVKLRQFARGEPLELLEI